MNAVYKTVAECVAAFLHPKDVDTWAQASKLTFNVLEKVLTTPRAWHLSTVCRWPESRQKHVMQLLVDCEHQVPRFVQHVEVHCNVPLAALRLPSSVRFLELGESFQLPVEKGDVPESVLSMTFHPSYQSEVHLPKRLQMLSINRRCRIPPALVTLELGSRADLSNLASECPVTLKNMSLCHKSTLGREFATIVPESVRNLTLANVFGVIRFQGDYVAIGDRQIPRHIESLKL